MKKVNYQKADAIRKRADRLDQIEFNLIRHDAQSLFLECGGPTLDLASEKHFAGFEKAITEKLAHHLALTKAREELSQHQYAQLPQEELDSLIKAANQNRDEEDRQALRRSRQENEIE